MEQNFGDLVIDVLQNSGVSAMFGVPGGQTMPIYRAARERGFQHVLMRDERNAACAADAFARVSQRVGVCDATVGPGATNLVSGLAEAQASSVPVVAIIADIRTSLEHLRTYSVASQSVEQAAMLRPVVKWFARVGSVDTASDVLDQALRVATTGRPGPVVVEVPEDIFVAPLPAGRARPIDPDASRWPRYRTVPTADSLEGAVAAIVAAQRPVLFAGGGAVSSGVGSEVVGLAEALGAPIVTTINGKGTVDERHPLALGVVGAFGMPEAGAALRDADVVIVLGSKLDQLSTFNWKVPTAQQIVIHIDIDGSEIGRAIPADIALVGDARETARLILERIGTTKKQPWVRPSSGDVPDSAPSGGVIHPRAVVAAIDAVLDERDVFVADASLSSGWSAQGITTKKAGRTFIAPRGLAGIGWVGGAAIGARLAADDDARVVALVGDGAWGYSFVEVETAVRLGLRTTFVVVNNSAFGWVVHGEQRAQLEVQSLLSDVDYAGVAKAMGAEGIRVSDPDEVNDAVKQAMDADGPCVIDIRTSATVSPIIGMRSLPAPDA